MFTTTIIGSAYSAIWVSRYRFRSSFVASRTSYETVSAILFQKAPDENLLFRIAIKTVDAREIDEFYLLVLVADVPALEPDRRTGILVYLDTKTGELVEDQGFSCPGITDECDLHGVRSTQIAEAFSGLSATSQSFTCTTIDRFLSLRLMITF